jgi:transcriptional regulator with XRE-family HTH domain
VQIYLDNTRQCLYGMDTEGIMEFDTDLLVRLRETKGLNMSQAAKGMGWTRQRLHQIENGANSPSLKTITKIAAFFDVPGVLFIKTLGGNK